MTIVMQHYDGPARPRNSVALIRINGGQPPEVVSVDDEPLRVGSTLEPGNRLHVEVLPGVHDVEVEAIDAVTGLHTQIAVRFVAEPGRVYRVDLVGAGAAQAYEVSRDTDAKLGIAAAAPSAIAPPRPTARVAPAVDGDAGVPPADANPED
jgi:hypothetical protein